MNHAELVERAERWLRKSHWCSVVLTELTAFTTTGEQPDALGFISGGVSILVECKTSRSDFLADAHKAFRICPASGMGDYRFFLCEPDVLIAADMPEGWGLLYARKKTITLEYGSIPKTYNSPPFQGHKKNELVMCVSALRRVGREAVESACHPKKSANGPEQYPTEQQGTEQRPNNGEQRKATT